MPILWRRSTWNVCALLIRVNVFHFDAHWGGSVPKWNTYAIYSNSRISKSPPPPYPIYSDNETVLGGEEGNASDEELIRMITRRDELATKTAKEITDIEIMRIHFSNALFTFPT